MDKQHCSRKSKNKAGTYECRLPRCTARSHGSAYDLLRHLESNHIIRYPLPCPIRGCEETFARQNYIPMHFQINHSMLDGREVTLHSPILKPTSRPLWPRTSKTLQPISNIKIDIDRILAPAVASPSLKPNKPLSATAKPLSRTWNHLSVPNETSKERATDSDEEPDSMPFDNLSHPRIPAEDEDPDFELPEFIVRRKPPESSGPRTRLSELPPILNFGALEGTQRIALEEPPTSMGFGAFRDRYSELEKAGLISGTGVWPDYPSRHFKSKRTDT
ncbi:hypothetical protein OE88DRAFT_1658210 [Heliocybe sulcata]|uniref:C2H2-type domain-containing protein n=1 Tax=Heliocybe sulcata TaxID=5364 RepID=A0A5C3N1N8_9AGAM|nr:hypothetical protein OE88DRAFT_1658210 [Heliocybe sulcata]